MAASVASSTVVFMFWLVCPVFSYILAISFPRDKLLDFRQCTPPEFSPVFNYSDVLLDIVFGGAAVLFKRFRTCRRGKWARARGQALVKLRQRRFRTALPTIHLTNLRSLPNNTDKLLLLYRTNKDFSNYAALFHGNLAEWRHTGQCIKSAELSADQSGGTCFYISEKWCTDVTVLKKMCCSGLETLFIICKPFYYFYWQLSLHFTAIWQALPDHDGKNWDLGLITLTRLNLINCKIFTILHHPYCCYVYIPCTTCLHIPLAHPCLYYYLLSPQYTYCTFYSLFFLIIFYLYLCLCLYLYLYLYLYLSSASVLRSFRDYIWFTGPTTICISQ